MTKELEQLEHEVTVLKQEATDRKTRAVALRVETEQKRDEATAFLSENEPRLPYRMAAARVGDPEWTLERVAAHRRELDEARRVIREAEELLPGLDELIARDWLANARLVKAMRQCDQAARQLQVVT